MTDCKPGKLAGCRTRLAIRAVDVTGHGSFNLRDESIDLGRSPLGHHLHAAVAQVYYVTRHRKARRDALRRIAKTDPLNAAVKMNCPPFAEDRWAHAAGIIRRLRGANNGRGSIPV